MNVASIELCKELYELSGWKAHKYYLDYDLGFLLRKLPVDYQLEDHKNQNDKKELGYSNYHMVAFSPKVGIDFVAVDAETPEDAACKLAIELFKKGILK
jgi:hypothetical protein